MIIIMGKENSGKFRLCRALEEQGLKAGSKLHNPAGFKRKRISYVRMSSVTCCSMDGFFQHTKTGPDGEW